MVFKLWPVLNGRREPQFFDMSPRLSARLEGWPSASATPAQSPQEQALIFHCQPIQVPQNRERGLCFLNILFSCPNPQPILSEAELRD